MHHHISAALILVFAFLMAGCGDGANPEASGDGTDPTAATVRDTGAGTDTGATAIAKADGVSVPLSEGTKEQMDQIPVIVERQEAGLGAAYPPEMVVGAAACAECHEQEAEVWRQSTHFTSFQTMPVSTRAQEIAKQMGIDQITDDSACVRCHFTRQKQPDGEIAAVSGVSCESCHGAAAEWIDIHHDYGDGAGRRSEDLAHRAERLRKCDVAGMIRPERLYDVALNCYECHTIPNEKLINTAGHPTGSAFELVSRYQVEIRHNFFASDGRRNDPAPGGLHPKHHMREMHVIGRFLDLEMTLRALEKATAEGRYLSYLTDRFNSLKENLQQIQDVTQVDIPEVTAGLAAVEGLELVPNNSEAYHEAAVDVTTQGREFAWKMYGGRIPEVDRLIPNKYKGEPLPEIKERGGRQPPGGTPGRLPPPPGVDPGKPLPPPTK